MQSRTVPNCPRCMNEFVGPRDEGVDVAGGGHRSAPYKHQKACTAQLSPTSRRSHQLSPFPGPFASFSASGVFRVRLKCPAGSYLLAWSPPLPFPLQPSLPPSELPPRCTLNVEHASARPWRASPAPAPATPGPWVPLRRSPQRHTQGEEAHGDF